MSDTVWCNMFTAQFEQNLFKFPLLLDISQATSAICTSYRAAEPIPLQSTAFTANCLYIFKKVDQRKKLIPLSLQEVMQRWKIMQKHTLVIRFNIWSYHF